MADNVSYIQGPAQALVIIHRPHVFRGAYRPTCSAPSTLSLSESCMGGEGHGRLYISILGL